MVASTTAVEVDPLCVTVVSGEQICANVAEVVEEGRKLEEILCTCKANKIPC